jgi:hypothetical protein
MWIARDHEMSANHATTYARNGLAHAANSDSTNSPVFGISLEKI